VRAWGKLVGPECKQRRHPSVDHDLRSAEPSYSRPAAALKSPRSANLWRARSETRVGTCMKPQGVTKFPAVVRVGPSRDLQVSIGVSMQCVWMLAGCNRRRSVVLR
jgi:hypothetical protein